jgi:hypothetical protein
VRNRLLSLVTSFQCLYLLRILDVFLDISIYFLLIGVINDVDHDDLTVILDKLLEEGPLWR